MAKDFYITPPGGDPEKDKIKLSYDNRYKLGIEMYRGYNIPYNLANDKFFKWRETVAPVWTPVQSGGYNYVDKLEFSTSGGAYSDFGIVYWNLAGVPQSFTKSYYAQSDFIHSIPDVEVGRQYEITGACTLRILNFSSSAYNQGMYFVSRNRNGNTYNDVKATIKTIPFTVEAKAISESNFTASISEASMLVSEHDLDWSEWSNFSPYGLFYLWIMPNKYRAWSRGILTTDTKNKQLVYFVDEIKITSVREKKYTPNTDDGYLDVGLYNSNPNKNCRLARIIDAAPSWLQEDYFNGKLKINGEVQKYAKLGVAPFGQALTSIWSPGSYTMTVSTDGSCKLSDGSYISYPGEYLKIITAVLCGGGGSGGSHGLNMYNLVSYPWYSHGGSGGGAGNTCCCTFKLDYSKNASYSIVVGAGGAESGKKKNGKSGGTTSITFSSNSYIKAGGGSGGKCWNDEGESAAKSRTSAGTCDCKNNYPILEYKDFGGGQGGSSVGGNDDSVGGSTTTANTYAMTPSGSYITLTGRSGGAADGYNNNDHGSGGGGGASYFGNGGRGGKTTEYGPSSGGTGAGGGGGGGNDTGGYSGAAGGNGVIRFYY